MAYTVRQDKGGPGKSDPCHPTWALNRWGQGTLCRDPAILSYPAPLLSKHCPPLSQHAFHHPSNSHLACSWKTEFKKWVYFATKVFESIRIFSQNVFFHIWFEDPLWSTSFILSSSERFSTWRLPGIATKFERMLLLDSIPRDADWNGPKSGMGSMVFKSSPRQTQCTQRIQIHSSKQ